MTHSFPTRRSSDLFRFRRPYTVFSAPVGIPQEESPHPLANKSASLAASPSRGRECAAPAPQTSKQEHHRRGKERSEEHTSELQSLMRISYAVFCLKKKKKQ